MQLFPFVVEAGVLSSGNMSGMNFSSCCIARYTRILHAATELLELFDSVLPAEDMVALSRCRQMGAPTWLHCEAGAAWKEWVGARESTQ